MFQVRIQTVVHMDCSAEIAWRAVHDPAVAAAVYRPLLQMRVKSGMPFPQTFVSGSDIEVALYLGGRVCVGSQRIAIEDSGRPECDAAPRTMRDTGEPLSGPLALLSYWNHEITISQDHAHSTIWRDELTIGGALAPIYFVVLQAVWHWRGTRLKRLARHWADDHQVQEPQRSPPPPAQHVSRVRTFISATALRKDHERHDPRT